jgi:SAM-dependent methyltransferase
MTGSRLSPTALLAIIQPWSAVAESVHRRVLQLSDATERTETLWVGCGSGRSVLWWAARLGGPIEGIDPDPKAIAVAERATRAVGLGRYVNLQQADPANLPHRDAVFDLAVIRMLQCGLADGGDVIAQASGVVRPGGHVIALVPTWFNTPGPGDADTLLTLGIRPRQLVEWKAACRAAGLVDLVVEEAAPDGTWLAAGRLGPLMRARRTAGWRGVATVLSPAFRTLRRLAETRKLGLSLIKGSRWPHAT